MNLAFLNPFSQKFLQVEPDHSDVRTTTARLNSYGKSEDAIDWRTAVGGYYSRYVSPSQPYDQNGVVFDTVFANKRQRINYYRNLARYPFVKKCLHIIANECVCETAIGDVATFGLNNAYKKKITDAEYKTLKEEFDYVINCVIHKDQMWYYFYKWLIDGELFLEICLNDEKNKVAGVKALPPFCTLCIWDEGAIDGFIEDPKLITPDATEPPKTFTKNQIAYANYGEYGTNMNDVRGHLEAAVRPINQLRAIEDALTVYRITRAPERRIWSIYGGKKPAAQVKEYMQEIRAQYRKELSLDPHTGMVVGGNNVQALSEDIWLAKDADGNGSTVENFKGSTEFNGQLEDVKMFREQVADALLIPASRWQSSAEGSAAQYMQGIEGVAMEEATFQKECRKMRKRFVQIIYQIFMVHLQVRGYNKKYLDSDIYNIDLIPATDFERMREIAIAEKMGGVVGAWSQFLPTLENSKPDTESLPPIISKQYMLEKMLGMTTEDMLLNHDMLEREKAEINEIAASVKKEGGDEAEDEGDMEF